jgi:formyl-CoA transferase
LIENFRPGVLEGWGLGWNELSAANPGLVLVRISGYGQDGPYRDRPGFAAIAEAIGGLRYITGYPDRAPVRAGVSLGDTLAALYAVIGALIALHHRNVNGGKGQVVDAALYEAVFGVTESLIPEYSRGGFIRERSGACLPGISPSNTYTCRDGSYVVIGGNSDGIFKRLMTAIDRPDLAADPSLTHNDGRVQKNEIIDAAISDWTSKHSLEEALSTLERAEVPVGKIYTAADIHGDPHFRHRGMIEHVVLPDGVAVDLPGIVPRLSDTPGRTAWIGPPLGAHAGDVLGGLGLDRDAVDGLRAEGVI